MTFYIYRFGASDIPQKLPSGTGLNPLLVGALQVLEVAIVFPASLPPDEKQALDNFMADRSYSFYAEKPSAATFHASRGILDTEKPLGDVWATLGGCVTNPKNFARDVAKVIGQVTGSLRTVGGGLDLQLIETDGAGVDTVLGHYSSPDTAGAWVTFEFFTSVPASGGLNTYRLEGQRGGAAEANVRFLTMVMLETL